MRCLKPRTVGFLADGKTISWSQKNYSKEYSTFQLPCGKCIPCRLEYARSTAVRCVHEAKMWEENSFITLTYSDENLKSDRLQYKDFQKFMKDLRNLRFSNLLKTIWPDDNQKTQRHKWKNLSKRQRDIHYETIRTPILVTGEYGDQRKRPHWHALIFNWRPTDTKYKYSNERGDKVYSSSTLDALWPHGITELGSVTQHSANYCARYATKKLVHGNDQEHEYQPVHRRSSKHAIGKKFIEKYWPDIFNHGHVILDDGTKTGIPRYYEKWLLKNQPEAWEKYVTKTKQEKINKAQLKSESEKQQYIKDNIDRTIQEGPTMTRSQINEIIITERLNRLQNHLKGDI